jgi:hypothetical protein
MKYMYKIYLISLILTFFLFIYNNKEHFDDKFTLPGKYDIHFVYFYSSKSDESIKLKEQIIKLKENVNNSVINCFKLRIFLVNLDEHPLTQRKYNINKAPTMFIMLMDKEKVYYEEFTQNPSYVNITNAINNIYTNKIQQATYRVFKARNQLLFNS